MIIKNLSKSQLYKIGRFDKGGRYMLSPFFETETSKSIRSPSRAWNLSIWKHCQTAKYLKSLSNEQLEKLKEICNF